jgi:hypothetical protein
VDSVKETELAKLIILIMNTQSAAEYVIRENELVMKNIIVLVLGSNNNAMKIMVCLVASDDSWFSKLSFISTHLFFFSLLHLSFYLMLI